MSDIHALSGDSEGYWTIVFHFAVPDVNNAIGVNYRTALVNSGLGGTSQMTAAETPGPGQISTAELGQIEAGELYEHSERLPVESGATSNEEVVAFVRAMYAQHEDTVIADLQNRLRYFGFTAAKE